jgi:uncharacterized membrane protein
MSKYQWLLFLHVTGAFVFLGATVLAVVLNVAAARRERPSDVAVLLRFMRFAVIGFGAGFALLIVFGLWLVHVAGYSYGAGWIVAALILFVAANALGGISGERGKKALATAERLAAEGDAPSPELRAMLRDPVTMALNYGAAIAGYVVLALMIFKPGAGG